MQAGSTPSDPPPSLTLSARLIRDMVECSFGGIIAWAKIFHNIFT